MDLVVCPHTLLESGGALRLHALYYITKQINPALERVLSLVSSNDEQCMIMYPGRLCRATDMWCASWTRGAASIRNAHYFIHSDKVFPVPNLHLLLDIRCCAVGCRRQGMVQ